MQSYQVRYWMRDAKSFSSLPFPEEMTIEAESDEEAKRKAARALTDIADDPFPTLVSAAINLSGGWVSLIGGSDATA